MQPALRPSSGLHNSVACSTMLQRLHFINKSSLLPLLQAACTCWLLNLGPHLTSFCLDVLVTAFVLRGLVFSAVGCWFWVV